MKQYFRKISYGIIFLMLVMMIVNIILFMNLLKSEYYQIDVLNYGVNITSYYTKTDLLYNVETSKWFYNIFIGSVFLFVMYVIYNLYLLFSKKNKRRYQIINVIMILGILALVICSFLGLKYYNKELFYFTGYYSSEYSCIIYSSGYYKVNKVFNLVNGGIIVSSILSFISLSYYILRMVIKDE